jgi:hypothetical protein
MAAVLACGEGAALSHLSAAKLWRVWRGAANENDVVTSRRHRPRRGIRIHSCRHLDPRDLTTHDGIPVTTMARTLVDLTDVLNATQLANVIHEAAFRRRFDATATRAAMTRAVGRRRQGVLADALAAHASGSAGTRSALEDRFLALVAAAGIPEPLTNVPIKAGGRRIEVDACWPERRLVVEIDGDGHTRLRTRRADAARDRALRAAGYDVVRLTAGDLERRGAVLAALSRTP